MLATDETTARPRLALLLLWGLPALLAADTFLAASAGWRPEGTIETALLVFIVIWGASSCLWIVPALRARFARLWRELHMLVLLAALGWTALEFAAHHLEASLHPVKLFHTRGPNLHNIFYPDPAYLPGIAGESHFTTGPDGVRAAEVPSGSQTLRILAIGGSSTECVYLDDAETWPVRLADRLARPETLWIGNVGISGFDTKDHLQFAEASPLLEGAAALVVQAGINDCWRFLAKEVDAMDYGRFKEPAPAPSAKAVPEAQSRRPLWTRSRAIQLYHTARQEAPPPEQQEGVGGREYQIRRDRRSAAEKTGALPPLAEGLALYRARIQQITGVCRQRKAPVLFTTQPVVWRADLSPEASARCWFGWLPDGRYLTLASLREAIDQYNATLQQTCAELGVPCVDLSPLNGSEAYFYDDCHFTEAGAEAVATLVAPALEALLER